MMTNLKKPIHIPTKMSKIEEKRTKVEHKMRHRRRGEAEFGSCSEAEAGDGDQ